MKFIPRPFYLNKLIDVIGSPDIKVITGIRRCGKSKLLEAFADYLLSTDANANVVRINFNLFEFEPLMEGHALAQYAQNHHRLDKVNYLLIDEVQMCDGFERAINSLHASELFDIYITGSNAFLLSSDLATLFTGRTFKIEVFPFSLREFSAYHEISDPSAALERYVAEGGMPGSYVYRDDRARYSYVSEVFEALIMRDIKTKHRIRKTAQLQRFCDFLMDNVGNVTSINNAVTTLSSSGLDISDKTAANYIQYLCNAFAFYRVRRFDVKGKRYLSTGEKYYLADQSFRYARLGTRNLDYGRIYENIVAIELLRRGYEVYAGSLCQKEIDFVALRGSYKFYIQVCDDLSSEETFQRKTRPLLEIRDAYPKVVLARTKHDSYDYEGIQVIDLASWLMNC